MQSFGSLEKLRGLIRHGRLRLIYVLAPPRTNSTFVARLLARPLDAALYEPALPAGPLPNARHARMILSAYARFSGKKEPVTLVVKDISIFVGNTMGAFIFDFASHIVFTIRDPLTQHPSLHARLAEEFTLAHRLKAFAKHPWATNWYGAHMSYLWPRILWQSRKEIPFVGPGFMSASSLAFNLACWRATLAHHRTATARMPAEKISVMDAGLSRLAPARTEAELAGISASIASPAAVSRSACPGPVEIAAHSLMDPDSHWAAKARSSTKIAPLEPDSAPPANVMAVPAAARTIDLLYPLYGEMFYAPGHRARAWLPGLTGQPGYAALRHLAEADDAAGAAKGLGKQGAGQMKPVRK